MEKKGMVPVGTKVSPEAYARLKSICEQKGFTLYDMLQMFCDVIIRYMDDRHNMSEKMSQMVAIFDGMKGWGKASTLLNIDHESKIVMAFYVLGSVDANSKQTLEGRRVFVVEYGADELKFENPVVCTFNMQDIFEKFIAVLLPEYYRYFRSVANELNCETFLEATYKMVAHFLDDKELAEFRKEFEDNDWVRNAKMGNQQPTKSTRDTQQSLFQ